MTDALEALRRAQAAAGLDPDAIAAEAATIDLDAPRHPDEERWRRPQLHVEPPPPEQPPLFEEQYDCQRCRDERLVWDPEIQDSVACPECTDAGP